MEIVIQKLYLTVINIKLIPNGHNENQDQKAVKKNYNKKCFDFEVEKIALISY